MVDKAGNMLKNMDIVSKDFKKLVIIDDGDLTYNMYKSKALLCVVKCVFARKYDKSG